jgi:hypothetical protein
VYNYLSGAVQNPLYGDFDFAEEVRALLPVLNNALIYGNTIELQ